MFQIRRVLVADDIEEICLQILRENGIDVTVKTKLSTDQLIEEAKVQKLKYQGPQISRRKKGRKSSLLSFTPKTRELMKWVVKQEIFLSKILGLSSCEDF